MSKDALSPACPEAALRADVAAIVVNYGTAALALEAVESLLAHPGPLAEVHLVDNASPGGDGAWLAEAIAARGWGGRVRLWAETVNHGFGRGNNLVIAELLARVEAGDGAGGVSKVFLLNPDARFEGAAVSQLSGFLDAHPRAGAVGARIEKPGEDGVPCPVTAAFRFPSLISVFSDAVSFGPLARLCAAWTVPLAPDTRTGRVDWVSGAAVMFRLEALRSVGAFDPDFFLYFEEVELMHRMGRGGWEVWHLAEAGVIHAEGAATGVKAGAARRPGYWYRSWRLYMEKSRGKGGARLAAGLWLCGGALNRVISALRGRQSGLPARFFHDLGTHVLRPLFGGRDT